MAGAETGSKNDQATANANSLPAEFIEPADAACAVFDQIVNFLGRWRPGGHPPARIKQARRRRKPIDSILPPKGAALFGASKAALNLWPRGMAKELGSREINVNAVAPGAVNIPDEPRSDALVELFAKDMALGRLATPTDIARAVGFLAGNDASLVTGELLTVSGGYRL